MKIAYCAACKAVVAAGALPATYPVRGRPMAYRYTHRAGDGATHGAVLLEVPDTPQGAGEGPGDYLARLAAAHQATLPP